MKTSEAPGLRWIAKDHPSTFGEFQWPMEEDERVDFRKLVVVSDTLLEGYAEFAKQGLPREMIGSAMLGATINLYDIFGMHDQLPALLRRIADRIEDARRD